MPMNPNMQNQAMQQAMGGGPQGPAPQGPPQGGAPPGVPPELMQLAFEMGLDLRNPEDLMMLIQMLGAGGGGPMGPMAGSGPGGQVGF